MFNLKSKKSKVTFFTDNEFLINSPDLWPQPASKFFPEWFKKVHKGDVSVEMFDEWTQTRNIRNCPVLAEYLTQGYIIPMWCDTRIMVKGDGSWQVITPSDEFEWDSHGEHQFINFIPETDQKKKGMATLKAICPWNVKLEDGYSLYQNQMYYHYNDDWEILPGSIKCDLWPDINQQVVIKKIDKEIFIPRGAPFVWYVPYKREKYDLEVKFTGDEEKNHINRARAFIATNFQNGYKKLISKYEK